MHKINLDSMDEIYEMFDIDYNQPEEKTKTIIALLEIIKQIIEQNITLEQLEKFIEISKNLKLTNYMLKNIFKIIQENNLNNITFDNLPKL